MKPYEPPDVDGWCDNCGEPCVGVWIDEGIGPYEYWGTRGVHHDWTVASDCCKATILEHDPHCSACGKLEVYDCGLCEACYVSEDETV